MSTLEEANEVIHPVESEWHYPIVTAAGFIPEVKEAKGLVRSYIYRHPNGVSVSCNTGYSCDYWRSSDGFHGYWADLQPYVNKMVS